MYKKTGTIEKIIDKSEEAYPSYEVVIKNEKSWQDKTWDEYVLFSFNGQKNMQQVEGLKIGQSVEITFDIISNKSKTKEDSYFTALRAFKAVILAEVQDGRQTPIQPNTDFSDTPQVNEDEDPLPF